MIDPFSFPGLYSLLPDPEKYAEIETYRRQFSISGLDVLKRLRTDPRRRLQPVVILTSSAEEQDRLASYGDGANSFVRKPLDFTEFAQSVARLGVYWLATNIPPKG
jgi:CheY-like chemotaxis protein